MISYLNLLFESFKFLLIFSMRLAQFIWVQLRFSAAVAFGKAVLSSVMGKNSKLLRREESLRWLFISSRVLKILKIYISKPTLNQ